MAEEAEQLKKSVVVVDEGRENDLISDAIRKNLEETVSAQEEAENARKAAAAPAKESHGPVSGDDSAKSPSAERTDSSAQAQTADGSGSSEQETPPKMTPKPQYHIVNVVQEVLNDTDVLQIMKSTGCCTCDRCQADVMAICLSRLPAQYVVTLEDNNSPLIGFYRSKNQTQIMAELMKACLAVKERSRHEK